MAGRQPVSSGGGMMSSAKVGSVSKDTQELLKVMMKESKLTAVQTRKLNESMKAGQALPRHCAPEGRHMPVKAQASGRPAAKKKSGGGVRSREAIVRSGAYSQDDTVPAVYATPVDPEKKERLQDEMMFGGVKGAKRGSSQSVVRPAAEEEELDRFDEVLQEIGERKSFLADMEAAGRAGQYRTIINNEVSMKIRELTAIDRQRTEELEAQLRETS